MGFFSKKANDGSATARSTDPLLEGQQQNTSNIAGAAALSTPASFDESFGNGRGIIEGEHGSPPQQQSSAGASSTAAKLFRAGYKSASADGMLTGIDFPVLDSDGPIALDSIRELRRVPAPPNSATERPHAFLERGSDGVWKKVAPVAVPPSTLSSSGGGGGQRATSTKLQNFPPIVNSRDSSLLKEMGIAPEVYHGIGAEDVSTSRPHSGHDSGVELYSLQVRYGGRPNQNETTGLTADGNGPGRFWKDSPLWSLNGGPFERKIVVADLTQGEYPFHFADWRSACPFTLQLGGLTEEDMKDREREAKEGATAMGNASMARARNQKNTVEPLVALPGEEEGEEEEEEEGGGGGGGGVLSPYNHFPASGKPAGRTI